MLRYISLHRPVAAGKPGRQRGSPRPAAGADDESSEDDEEPFTQAATQPTPQVRCRFMLPYGRGISCFVVLSMVLGAALRSVRQCWSTGAAMPRPLWSEEAGARWAPQDVRQQQQQHAHQQHPTHLSLPPVTLSADCTGSGQHGPCTSVHKNKQALHTGQDGWCTASRLGEAFVSQTAKLCRGRAFGRP